MKRHPVLQRGVARPVCAALAKLVTTPSDVVIMMEGDEGLELGPGDILGDLRQALCHVAQKGPGYKKTTKEEEEWRGGGGRGGGGERNNNNRE